MEWSKKNITNWLFTPWRTRIMIFLFTNNIVDAFTAQNADENTKPIAITFALIGLYLCVEENYTGKEVQNAHMALAKKRKNWPIFELPEDRGEITASNVLAVPPGPERDEMIKKWCQSVWSAYSASHQNVADLYREVLGQ